MCFGARGDQRHNSRDAQFRTFFYRPFHAIELEDGNGHSDGQWRGSGDCISQFKLDPILRNCGNSTQVNIPIHRYFEFLTNLRAQNLSKMPGMIAEEKSVPSGDFVSDPASASHKVASGE